MPIWLQGIITLLAAVIASGATWATVKAANSKMQAEEAEIITRTALLLIEPMKIEITDLKARVKELEAEVEEVLMWAKRLSAQVLELGHSPAPLREKHRNG